MQTPDGLPMAEVDPLGDSGRRLSFHPPPAPLVFVGLTGLLAYKACPARRETASARWARKPPALLTLSQAEFRAAAGAHRARDLSGRYRAAMGISECGTKLFTHVRSEVTLNAYSGKRLVVDVASFKLKAWYQDVPQYYRSSEPQSHGYRAILSRLLSALSMAAGATSNVVVCLMTGAW